MESPTDLIFNRGRVTDPSALAQEVGAASWLFLCGEEFAAMEGGLSYDQVQAAVPESRNVISDPPRELDLALLQRNLDALDDLPRPTLVTCRMGPRSSAVVYTYAGLRSGATADEVLERAAADEAPFLEQEGLVALVREAVTSGALPA